MLALAISMSLFLAYNIAYVNKDLKLQLANVKTYSEKALEQERIAIKAELERRIIKVENDRKTKELEEARELQLSLLPKTIPQTDELNISCFMQTATEVGGDYYDFFNYTENNLTIAIGDATGHGLKAGNMVMTMKGLLNILSDKTELTQVLAESNATIKRMNLHMLTMCLALLRIKDNKIEYSSAGMPPLLVYRFNSKLVETIVLKAMPLGAFNDFPYEKKTTEVGKGDVIIMMSDGLTELFNNEKETYGIDNIKNSIAEISHLSAEQISNKILEESKIWSGDTPLRDDITLIVIKILK